MGTDYECGCRQSGGHWFLCDKHKDSLEPTLIEYTKASFVKEVYDKVMSTKLSQATEVEIVDNAIWITNNKLSGCFNNNDFNDLLALKKEYKNDITIAFHLTHLHYIQIIIRVI